jgi:hypothetical protein
MSSNYHHRQHRGRIHAGERDDDANDAEKEPSSYTILPEHISRIAETVKHAVKDNTRTRRDYRSRLCRMVDWCVVKYPVFAEGIRSVTEEEKMDPTKMFLNQEKRFYIQQNFPRYHPSLHGNNTNRKRGWNR